MYLLENSPIQLIPEIIASEALVLAKRKSIYMNLAARFFIDVVTKKHLEDNKVSNSVENVKYSEFTSNFEDKLKRHKLQHPDIYSISPEEATALYDITRRSLERLDPDTNGVIVETGVNHGVSSQAILEAIEDSERDVRLLSFDLPYPNQPVEQIGCFVEEKHKKQWDLLISPSQNLLQELLNNSVKNGENKLVGLWHDSKHTCGHILYELFEAHKHDPLFIACHDAIYPNPIRSPFKIFCGIHDLDYEMVGTMGITELKTN